MFIDFRLGLRLPARNSLVMTPFEVTVLSVTLNAAGTVPSANNRFPPPTLSEISSVSSKNEASAVGAAPV